MRKLKLLDGNEIPVLGLGTWQLRGHTAVRVVEKAIEVGYRLIDTADVYGNHREIGTAIKNSGIERKDLFITSKVWSNRLNTRNVLADANRFLQELQTDYIDLLLIHWPNPRIPVEETLAAMSQLKEEGKISSMGVSNFDIPLLEKALKTGFTISNNQVELHPTFNQNELVNYCKEKGIIVTAYSPLGRGIDLEEPIIFELSQKYKVLPAQVVLNWITSQDIVAIPKSADSERIEDNFKSLDWKMDKDDIEKINNIPQEEKLVLD